MLIFLLSAAFADDIRVTPVTDPVVREECAACHMAFQPAFLPAKSWRAIMAGLGDHFGEVATVTPEKSSHIEQYLVSGAARDRGEAPLRITELRWWVHEHGPREIDPARFAAPEVKSKANCLACHPAADKGRYED